MALRNLSLIVLVCGAVVSVGCSVERTRVAVTSHPVPDVEEIRIAAKEPSLGVAPVAYQEDGVEGSEPITPEVISHPGMTLETLQQLAIENNPSIQQVSAAASRAAGIQEQVGLKPNPRIGYFADEIGDNNAAGLHGAFVSQMFVTGGKLGSNQHVLAHDLESMMWQVEAQRMRVLTDIRVRFFQALAAQRRIELAREFRVVAEKGLRVAKDRLEAEGTRPDVLQSEIQLGEVDLLIRRAELEFNGAWNELVAIAGVPDMPPTTLVGELEVTATDRSIDELYQQLVAESPLVKAAYEQVYRSEANLHRQQVQARPNLTGQLGVGHDDSTGNEFVNVQLSLPLPVHNGNQGNIRAAHAAVAEAANNLQRIKLQIREDLARVMREYEVAAATVKQYESTILPKAKESQELITETHAAGEFDFLRVLTARKIFFDVNLQYVNALSDLATANAQIEGLLLRGGLSTVTSYTGDDGLRGQALSGQ